MLNVMVFENGGPPRLVGTIFLLDGKLGFTGEIESIVLRLRKDRTDQEAYDYAPVMLSRGHMWTTSPDLAGVANTAPHLAQRKGRADLAAFTRILKHKGGEPPREGDEKS